jgi:hypothetical protein
MGEVQGDVLNCVIAGGSRGEGGHTAYTGL